MNHHESIRTQMIQLYIEVISILSILKASCKSVRWQKLHCSPPGTPQWHHWFQPWLGKLRTKWIT